LKEIKMDRYTCLKVVALINAALEWYSDPASRLDADLALILARGFVEDRLLALGWRNDPVDVPEMDAAKAEVLAQLRDMDMAKPVP
jgi:hypothetical protein